MVTLSRKWYSLGLGLSIICCVTNSIYAKPNTRYDLQVFASSSEPAATEAIYRIRINDDGSVDSAYQILQYRTWFSCEPMRYPKDMMVEFSECLAAEHFWSLPSVVGTVARESQPCSLTVYGINGSKRVLFFSSKSSRPGPDEEAFVRIWTVFSRNSPLKATNYSRKNPDACEGIVPFQHFMPMPLATNGQREAVPRPNLTPTPPGNRHSSNNACFPIQYLAPTPGSAIYALLSHELFEAKVRQAIPWSSRDAHNTSSNVENLNRATK